MVTAWYQDTLSYLEHTGFELSMADALILRQMIKEAWDEGKELKDDLWISAEGVIRWLFHYYGVNKNEIEGDKPVVNITMEELAKMIKKYREEREMI